MYLPAGLPLAVFGGQAGGQVFPIFPGGWEMSLHGKFHRKGKYS